MVNGGMCSVNSKKKKTLNSCLNKENLAQLQISVAYFCSIGLYFLV